MINVQKEPIKTILQNLHASWLEKVEANSNERTLVYMKDNSLFSVLSRNIYAGPQDCSRLMGEYFDYDMSEEEIIKAFNYNGIANPVNRQRLYKWIRALVANFARGLEGDEESYAKFLEIYSTPPTFLTKYLVERGRLHRMVLISIFSLYRELNVHDDFKLILCVGDTWGKYFLFDLIDATAKAYSFPPAPQVASRRRSNRRRTPNNTRELSYKEALEKIELLEGQLERTDAMMKDFEEEFEQQLGDSKSQEVTEFFSKLNSDKYGRILDELFFLRKGIDKLRSEHYVAPFEINGLMIMATKLLQFVKDSNIAPMMKVGSQKQVTATEIESCVYEGTPFADNTEVKTVRVISPGWIYREKDIQISRPRLKEEQNAD